MEPLLVGFLGIAATLVLVLCGAPVGATLGLVAFCGLWKLLTFQSAVSMSVSLPFEFVADWSLSAVPMFILMGFVAAKSGIAGSIFRVLSLLLFRLPGGLACASVGACAVFASASGSSVATAAAMGRVCIPEMSRAGYRGSLAAGCVAASGTLGSLIPPSILIIIYAYFAEVSISAMFLAALLPGLVTAIFYAIMIVTRVFINPDLAPGDTIRTERGDLISSFKQVFFFPLLVFVVLGGVLAGIFTPTEGGAIGAASACVIALAFYRMPLSELGATILESARSTCSIFFIAVGAVIYARFIFLSGIPQFVTDAFGGGNVNTSMFVLQVALILIILGMFVDAISLMLITLPVFIPVANSMGLDLIWFGIVIIKLIEIGLVTPPVGMNVYVIAGVVKGQIDMIEIFKGAAWFILMDLAIVFLLVAFPSALILRSAQ
ncbi:MAG: TRAP transporter large permease subunit [Hyphomicrobiaceae bacterium]|nr:TRAP transporter large permease subunit [Hyphomicrobiaceae bacterium]